MINIERLKEQLVIHEGLRLKPYKCSANKTTIGVGRNIEDVGITRDEAMMLLENDISRVTSECMNNFDWFMDLSLLRREAIINLVFNMGMTKFKQFKKTIAFLEQGLYPEAGAELLNSRYAQQVGNRAVEVANQIAHNPK